MIPVGIRMIDDELMTGWLFSIAAANGMAPLEFCSVYLGWEARGSLLSRYPKKLESVCERHKDMAFFPDVSAALLRHTDFSVASLGFGRGVAAGLAETILRDAPVAQKLRSLDGGFRYCPECMSEDRKRYGRKVIHVPHQMAGVTGCWKHGCPLENDRGKLTDTVTDAGLRIAAYARALYLEPLDGGKEQAMAAIRMHLSEQDIGINSLAESAALDGYLDAGDIHAVVEEYYGKKRRKFGQIVRLLAYLYPDIKELRKAAGKPVHVPMDTAEFELLDAGCSIGRYRCRDCGHVFYMHERAVDSGMVCPACHNGLDKAAQMRRLLERYRDGEYELTEQGKLRHKVCGNDMTVKRMFWLYEGGDCWFCNKKPLGVWQEAFADTDFTVEAASRSGGNSRRILTLCCQKCGTRFLIMNHTQYLRRGVGTVVCPGCDGGGQDRAYLKRMREERIGQRRVAATGIGATVVGYDGINEVTVRFDNGLERQMGWNVFKKIDGRCKLPEIHIGEKRRMKDGEEAEIVMYKSREKIRVRFTDGVEVDTDYRRFRIGTVQRT